MAKNRSRRLRKKLCVDEFQELGVELQMSYPEGTDDAVVEAFFADLVVEAVEAKGMALIGGEEFAIVCSGKRGSVTEEQRAELEEWLKGRKELSAFEVSPLLDVWYPENSVNLA
ncbi:50S ribosome-binding protein YggL [Denitrificimonas sp. JX-1]|uniref:50S ribosome-binding protein YggL n=1 Tax=Denitrificimonas halotolerans TaxID=3098930 RepID=A0ABU5GT51_9GAMM|nr:50S ribosome-binding protein YggL [Denitrificimonas sp. JX-1]MDY7218818.1 50S ribosome-binding protein YggL [Denitrificimonas sp. JX-1]